MSEFDNGEVVVFPKRWQECTREGLGYCFRPRDSDIALHVSRLRRQGGDLYGRLDVEATISGLPGHLLRVQHKFEGSTANNTLAKVLQEATHGVTGLAWPSVIQRLTRAIVDAEEQDGEDEDLLEPTGPLEISWRVDRLLVDGVVNVVYGPGGAGKGFVAVAMGVCIQAGLPFAGFAVKRGNVLYLDWEDSKRVLEQRIAMVCAGWSIPFTPLTKYHRYSRRLVDVIDAVARTCDEHDISTVIIDSVGAAMGAAGEHGGYEDSALRLNACCRLLGDRTLLLIDHVNAEGKRGEQLAGKQYGSIYKQNYARNCLEMKADRERGSLEIPVALYQTKTNHTTLLAPVGLNLDFRRTGTVRITQQDARDSDVLSRPLSLRYRIDGALARDNWLTYRQLFEAFPDEKPETISRTVQRGLKELRYREATTEDGLKRFSRAL